MIIPLEKLRQVVAAGGGLVLDAPTLTFGQLRELVVAAGTHGAQISLKHVAALTGGQMLELAALAPGLVSFDLSA